MGCACSACDGAAPPTQKRDTTLKVDMNRRLDAAQKRRKSIDRRHNESTHKAKQISDHALEEKERLSMSVRSSKHRHQNGVIPINQSEPAQAWGGTPDVRKDSMPATETEAVVGEARVESKPPEVGSVEAEPVRVADEAGGSTEQEQTEIAGEVRDDAGVHDAAIGKDRDGSKILIGNEGQGGEEGVDGSVGRKESVADEAEAVIEKSAEKLAEEVLAAGDTEKGGEETESEGLEKEAQKTESEELREKIEEDKLIAEILSSNPASQVALVATRSDTSATKGSPRTTPRGSRPGTPRKTSSMAPVASSVAPLGDDSAIAESLSPTKAQSRTSRPDSPRPGSPDPALLKTKSTFSSRYGMLEPRAVSPVPEVDSLPQLSPRGSFQVSDEKSSAPTSSAVAKISSAEIVFEKGTSREDSVPEVTLEDYKRPGSPVPPDSEERLKPAAASPSPKTSKEALTPTGSPVQAWSKEQLKTAASPVAAGSQELVQPVASPAPLGSQEQLKPATSAVPTGSQGELKYAGSAVPAGSQEQLKPATSQLPAGSQEELVSAASAVHAGSQELAQPSASPVPTESQEQLKPTTSPVPVGSQEHLKPESQDQLKPAASPVPVGSQEQLLPTASPTPASADPASQQDVIQCERVKSLIDAEHRPPTPPPPTLSRSSSLQIPSEVFGTGATSPGLKSSFVQPVSQEPSVQSVKDALDGAKSTGSIKPNSASNVSSLAAADLKSSASGPKSGIASNKGSSTSAKSTSAKMKSSSASMKASSTSTKASATNAKVSFTSARASSTNKKASATSARVSVTSAKASTTSTKASAKTSNTSAKTSNTSAKASATSTKAKTSNTSTKASNTSAKTSTTSAKGSRTSAKTSTTSASVKRQSISSLKSKSSEKSLKGASSKGQSKDSKTSVSSTNKSVSVSKDLDSGPPEDKSSDAENEQLMSIAVDPRPSVDIVIDECSPNKLSDASLASEGKNSASSSDTRQNAWEETNGNAGVTQSDSKHSS